MTIPALSEADEELLSAYLDQELTPLERSELEQRLVVEDNLRQQLAELRRACDLLEELPNATLKPDFTRTTMEMVAINLEREVDEGANSSAIPRSRFQALGHSAKKWWASRNSYLKLGSIACLAVLLGSIVGWRIRVASNRNELRAVAVAAYLPTLQCFPRLTLLQQLKEIPYWEDLLEDGSVRERMLPAPPFFKDLTNVRRWVGSLDVKQQSVLWSQNQELLREDTTVAKKTLEHYLEIQSQPDSQELLQVGSAFVALLKAMPSNRRDEILSLTPIERQIIRLRQDAYYTLALNHTDDLSKEEKIAIMRWGHDEFEERLRDAMPIKEKVPLERLLYFAMYFLPQQYSSMNLSDHEELCESLCQGLSEKSSTLFRGVAHESQTLVMLAWLLRANGFNEAKPPTNEELFAFYRDLPDEKREEIDIGDPAQVLERLKSEYRRKQTFQQREKRVEKQENNKAIKSQPAKNGR